MSYQSDLAVLTTVAAYNATAKAAFARVARKYLRRLAAELALPKGSYEIRYDPAGIAVSGDVILHGEQIYVWVDQRPFQNPAQQLVLYRGCYGRGDYVGLASRYVDAEGLLDTPTLANLCRVEMHRVQMKEGVCVAA